MGDFRMTAVRSAALRVQGQLDAFLSGAKNAIESIFESCRVSAYLLLFILLLLIDGLWNLVSTSKTTLEDPDGIEQG